MGPVSIAQWGPGCQSSPCKAPCSKAPLLDPASCLLPVPTLRVYSIWPLIAPSGYEVFPTTQ